MGDRTKRRASQMKYTDNSDDDSLEEFLNERVPYNRPTPVVLEKISDAQVSVMNAAECISILRARQVIGMKETPKWSLQTMRERVKQEIKKAQRGEGTTIKLEDDDEEEGDGEEDGDEDEDEDQNEDDEEEEVVEVNPRAKRRRSSDHTPAKDEDQDVDIMSPASSNQPPSTTPAPSDPLPVPPTATTATPVPPPPKKAPARKPKPAATPVPFSSPGSGFDGPLSPKAKVGISCGYCRLKHRGCDGNRPCRNCVNVGAADGCADPPPWMRSERRNRDRKATATDGASQTTSAGSCVLCAKKANSECAFQRCRSCCQADDLDCLVHTLRMEDGTPRVKPVPLIQGLSRSGLPLPFVHSLQVVEDPLALVHPADSTPFIARAAPMPPISQLITQCPYCGDLVSNIGVDLHQHMSRCDPTAFHEYLAGRASLPAASPSSPATSASTSPSSHTATSEPLQLAQANAEQRIAKQLAIAHDLFGTSPTVEETFKLLQYEATKDGDRLAALQKRLAALESVVQRHTQRTAQQYNTLAEKQRVRSEVFWKLYEALCKAVTTQEIAQVQAAYEAEMQAKVTSSTVSSSTRFPVAQKAVKVTRAQQDSVRRSLKAENTTSVLVKL